MELLGDELSPTLKKYGPAKELASPTD